MTSGGVSDSGFWQYRKRRYIKERSPMKTKQGSSKKGSQHSKLLTRAEAYAIGKQLRDKCPRSDHAKWKALHGRTDAVEMVLAAEKGRVSDLLPLRHGRMARSAFTFYRGAALTMAADLASTQASGLRVQCCGDAHLSNFGGFATPERNIFFDINDFDETLPAPWEWDIKRLSASIVIAARHLGMPDSDAAKAATAAVCSYRERMTDYASMRALDVWYDRIDLDRVMKAAPTAQAAARIQQRVERRVRKVCRTRCSPSSWSVRAQRPRSGTNLL